MTAPRYTQVHGLVVTQKYFTSCEALNIGAPVPDWCWTPAKTTIEIARNRNCHTHRVHSPDGLGTTQPRALRAKRTARAEGPRPHDVQRSRTIAPRLTSSIVALETTRQRVSSAPDLRARQPISVHPRVWT